MQMMMQRGVFRTWQTFVPFVPALFRLLEQPKPLVRLRFEAFLYVCSFVPYIYNPFPKILFHFTMLSLNDCKVDELLGRGVILRNSRNKRQPTT
jgi:hypothetical protein